MTGGRGRSVASVLSIAVAVLSLILLFAAVGMWARSHWMTYRVTRSRAWQDGGNLCMGSRSVLFADTGVWLMWQKQYTSYWSAQDAQKFGMGTGAHWNWGSSPVTHGTLSPHPAERRWGPFRWLSEDVQTAIYMYRTQSLTIPYWLPAAGFAAWPAVHLLRYLRRFRARRSNHCPGCGYDLSATRERCPECGTEIEAMKFGSAGRH